MAKLNIATCQFAVSSSPAANGLAVQRLMRAAATAAANIVHFPECAMCGYGGVDIRSLDGYDWDALRTQTSKIMTLAAQLRLWVVLGSMHQLGPGRLPHNCLYLISPDGTLADRYDKRFCMPREMEFYTPGNRPVTFALYGVNCALLICYELRFPEIYRQLRRLGVDCVIQSFYNARQSGPSVHTRIMRQTMQAHAATNFFWASVSNSSAPYSPYPSCFIRPDGAILSQLRLNRPGLMVNTVDTAAEFYDASAPYRQMAMDGLLSNGPAALDDPRSKNTTTL